MFTRLTRSGGRTYLQIVEAYRSDSGATRQRVIANLGRLDKLASKNLDPLINGLNRALGRSTNPAAAIEYDSARAFGDVFALHELWNELGLRDALRRALRSSRRAFDAEALARAMVFNRLCDPDSKLGVLRWLETVAIPGMPETVSHDHLLRTMDLLTDRGDAVDAAVSRLIRPLIDQELSVVFYDLTTVRIHGEAELTGDVRAYGMNKETGGIARQFVLGLVQTSDGLPLMHMVHPGNVAEVRTLRAMLEEVLRRFAVQRVILVADRGLLSLDNVAQLTELAASSARQIEFILAVPARRYGELGEVMDRLEFTDGVAQAHFAEHRLVVAHDAGRAAEQGARRRARIAELEAFAERLVGKLDAQDDGITERGRRATDRGAYSRFARALADAELTRFVRADYQADRFSYTVDEAAILDAERFDGKLVLLTSVADMTGAQIIERYKSLADIERGFRVLKSDIEIAPVYHRLPERIRAHAQICYLALVLHRVMRMRLRAKGSTLSPTRALRLLSRIQSHRATIGATHYSGVSRLTAEQARLFEDLNLPKPPAKAM
ncbi:MAG: IS1634 family transposase [Chloroflexota bacterium]|nr:IS1634 family transposase [Chloroflexota bacterium]